MNKRMMKRASTALLSLLLAGLLPSGTFAQQPSGTGGTSDASKGNAMTGGAEAQPTDKGTPAPAQDAAGASGTGGTSDASKGNTMTGGAEAQPTDKGTPAPTQDAAGASGTGGTSDASKGNAMTGGAEAQPTDKGTPGASSGSGQGKP